MKEKLSAVCLALALLLLVPFVCTAQTTTRSDNKENRVVVTGAVRQPARLEFRRRTRLIEALAIAGGVTNETKGGIRIEHTSGETDVYSLDDLRRGNKNANPYLRPGDVITVLK